MNNESLLALMQAYELSLKLPQYAAIRAELQDRLQTANNGIAAARAKAAGPKAVPSTPVDDESDNTLRRA